MKTKEFRRIVVADDSESEPEPEPEPQPRPQRKVKPQPKQESKKKPETTPEPPTIKRVYNVRYSKQIMKIEYEIKLIGKKEKEWLWRDLFEREADAEIIKAFNEKNKDRVEKYTEKLVNALYSLQDWKTQIELTPTHAFWDGHAISWVVLKVKNLYVSEGALWLEVLWKGFDEPYHQPFEDLGIHHEEVQEYRRTHKAKFDELLKECSSKTTEARQAPNYYIVGKSTRNLGKPSSEPPSEPSSESSSDDEDSSSDVEIIVPSAPLVPKLEEDEETDGEADEDTPIRTDADAEEDRPAEKKTLIEELKENMPQFLCRGCVPKRAPRVKGPPRIGQRRKNQSSSASGSAPKCRRRKVKGKFVCTCIQAQIGAWLATKILEKREDVHNVIKLFKKAYVGISRRTILEETVRHQKNRQQNNKNEVPLTPVIMPVGLNSGNAGMEELDYTADRYVAELQNGAATPPAEARYPINTRAGCARVANSAVQISGHTSVGEANTPDPSTESSRQHSPASGSDSSRGSNDSGIHDTAESTNSFWENYGKPDASASSSRSSADTIPGLGGGYLPSSWSPSSTSTPLPSNAASRPASSSSSSSIATTSTSSYETLEQTVASNRQGAEIVRPRPENNEPIIRDRFEGHTKEEPAGEAREEEEEEEEELLARDQLMEVDNLGEQPMDIDENEDKPMEVDFKEEEVIVVELPLWRVEDFSLNNLYYLETAVKEFTKCSLTARRNVVQKLLEEALNRICAFPHENLFYLICFMKRIRNKNLGLERIRSLVQAGTLPNISHLAVSIGNVELVEIVRGFHGATDTSCRKTVLDVAFEEERIEVFRHLLRKGASTANMRDWHQAFGLKAMMMRETGYFLEEVAAVIRDKLSDTIVFDEIADFFICQRKDAIRLGSYKHNGICAALLAIDENSRVVFEEFLGPRKMNDENYTAHTFHLAVNEHHPEETWFHLNSTASERYSTSFAAVMFIRRP